MRKAVLFTMLFIALLMGMPFLYQRQLGAVCFLLFAILFFVLAARQFSEIRKEKGQQQYK